MKCNGKMGAGAGTSTPLVDSEPEVLPPEAGMFPYTDVDAILISNYTCMLALPFITETEVTTILLSYPIL